MADYILEDLAPEDQEKLTEELTAILDKYDAEIGVTSSITVKKRVPTAVPSPIQMEDLEHDSNSDSTTEESS